MWPRSLEPTGGPYTPSKQWKVGETVMARCFMFRHRFGSGDVANVAAYNISGVLRSGVIFTEIKGYGKDGAGELSIKRPILLW
jgi:hypothetical protein